MNIILASKSPRREKVLKDLGLKFEVIPSHFNEKSVIEKEPLKLVGRLALEKARVVAKKYPNALVIGADNVVTLEGKIVGKPKDLAEAKRILLKSSGNTLPAYNGVAVIYKGKEKSTATIGYAVFRKFSEREVEEYLKSGNPLDKAGGFAGEPSEGGQFLKRFDGEPGEELGFPTRTLKKLLSEFGLNI